MNSRFFVVSAFVTFLIMAPASAGAQSSGSCPSFTYNLYFGMTDAQSGGQVSILQEELGGEVTGYFGPVTERLLQAWQARNGIVSSGNRSTTGYGALGPRTRALLASACGNTQQPLPTEVTPVDDANGDEEINLYADFVASNVSVTEVEGGQDYAEFEVTVDLTAEDSDIYVTATKLTEDATLSSVGANTGWSFDVAGATVASGGSAISSEADVVANGTAYVIEEGDTKEFTISAVATTTTNLGRLTLGAIQYGTSASSLFGRTLYVDTNTFRTPSPNLPEEEEDEDEDALQIVQTHFEVMPPSRGPAPFSVHVLASIETRRNTCGPLKMGTIDWGDGSRKEEVVAERAVDQCMKKAIDNLRHAYAFPGRYTVKFKDYEGETHTASVVVTAAETSFRGVDLEVSPYGGNAYTFVANVDVGNWTDYTYELDWGEGDSSAQTVRSKVVTVCNSPWTCSSPAGQLHEYAASGLYTINLYALKQTDNGTSRTLVKSAQARASTEIVTSVPPTISSFTVSHQGGEAYLASWSSKNADYCSVFRKETGGRLNTVETKVKPSGSLQVSPLNTNTTEYVLTCYGADPGNGKDRAEVSRSATVPVQVATSAPTCSVTASNDVITAGQSTKLSWSSKNATHGEGPFGDKIAVSGTLAYAPTTSTTYSFTFYGAGGQKTCSTRVTVEAAPVAATPTVQISALPTSVTAGQAATLSWKTANAARCVLSYGTAQESVSTSGSRMFYPYQTTTYRLWCANDPGTGKDGPSAESSATVNVTQERYQSEYPTLEQAAAPKKENLASVISGFFGSIFGGK